MKTLTVNATMLNKLETFANYSKIIHEFDNLPFDKILKELDNPCDLIQTWKNIWKTVPLNAKMNLTTSMITSIMLTNLTTSTSKYNHLKMNKTASSS